MDDGDFPYHIALSFAGENRPYVERVASTLRDRGVRVFYDRYEPATLWGKDLFTHLSDVYRKQARYTVIFISEQYAAKVWTNHERRSAQARALTESHEYILPVRFDDTELPGLLPTIAYIDANTTPPLALAYLIMEKLRLAENSDTTTPSGRPGADDALWRSLAVGLSRQYLEAKLGIPPVQHQVRSSGFIETAYSYPQYYVQVIYDDADQVAFYGITSKDASFHPELPVIGGALGEKPFAEYPDGECRYHFLTSKHYGYAESYYFGNPGNYHDYYLAHNSAGVNYGRQFTPVDFGQTPVLDCRAAMRARPLVTPNTYGVGRGEGIQKLLDVAQDDTWGTQVGVSYTDARILAGASQEA